MAELDMYGEKVADACALIREVSGGSEYFMVFDRHVESILEFFVAAKAEIEKRTEQKHAEHIADLESQLNKAPSQLAEVPNRLTDQEIYRIADEFDSAFKGSSKWEFNDVAKFARAVLKASIQELENEK